jgi:hypothetical protein
MDRGRGMVMERDSGEPGALAGAHLDIRGEGMPRTA